MFMKINLKKVMFMKINYYLRTETRSVYAVMKISSW